jgi:cobalt/nickel transport system permease protein
MHLGNGALTPECAIFTASLAAAGLGFAAASGRRAAVSQSRLLAAGAWGAAIFAAQMVNVPVLPFSSGHLVGGVLLAVALGPGLGALTMAVVLLLQAILLGDGGLSALGANVLNMALLPAAVVAVGQAWQRNPVSSLRGSLHAGAQGAIAVLLAAGLIVIEVAIARPQWAELPVGAFAMQMLLLHALIAALEGAVTFGIAYALQRSAASSDAPAWRLPACAAVALLALVPLASGLPDGYEASATRSAWTSLLTEAPASLPDQLNATLATWQASMGETIGAVVPGELALGSVATLLAGCACASLAWSCSRRSSSQT